MQTPNLSSDNPSYSGMSVETIYLAEMLICCRELRHTFKDKDSETFQLYVDYLRSAIIDERVTKDIDDQIAEMRAKLEADRTDPSIIAFRCGFVTIKAMFKFLNFQLDLVHEDIGAYAYGDLINLDLPPRKLIEDEERGPVDGV